jgi:hypothetical protein
MAKVQNPRIEQSIHIWSMSKSLRVQNPLIVYSYTPTHNLWEDELQMPQITPINKQHSDLRTEQDNEQMIKPQWQPQKRSREKQIVSWSNFIIIHTSTYLANWTFKTIHCFCIDDDLIRPNSI